MDDFQKYQEQITSSLVAITRSAGALSNQDLGFHRSSETVSRSLDRQNAHLLRLTNKLLKAVTQDSTIKTPQPKDKDGVEDEWRGMVDVFDDLLEKTDASLDEYTGAIKRMTPPVTDHAPTPPRAAYTESRPFQSPRYRRYELSKPQLLFDKKVNNYETEPFKPLLTSKPHAIVPLEESSTEHPYATEIEAYQYPEEVYQQAEPIPFWPPEREPAVFVDSEQGVQLMLEELKAAKEIAVDLEHHDMHTYTGIVCLMQISTRNKDWIVDTLKPWRENLQILNEVFTNPNIIKVFHGSAMDMIWLQRDLGLYVVGLFDTYYACDALAFPGKGLKYLLQRFAGFEAQKQYQLSDWRQRPLGQELIDYARSDTHYLLYIYDEVRNLLVANSTEDDNLIDHVLQGSKKESLQKHERFVYDFESGRGSGGWFGLYVDRNNNFTPQQFAVYKALHSWRDAKARELDEAPYQIMKHADLMAIAEAMPKNMTSIYKISRPQLKFASSELAPEIFPVVAKAMDESKDDPPVHEQIRENELKYGVRPQNRWRKPPPSADRAKSQLTGLAATLHYVQANGDMSSNAPSTQPVKDDVDMGEANSSERQQPVARSDQSGLWGPIMLPFMSMPFTDTMMTSMALNTLLPLPDLSGNPFTVTEETATPIEVVEQPAAAAVSVPTTPQDDTFTLHDRSKRKRKADEEMEDDDIDPFADQSLNSITDEDAMVYGKPGQGSAAVNSERAASKAQRKAEKRVRRRVETEEKERREREMVPFDYDAAEPMLNASSNAPGGVTKGKKPHMNPFAKALDTGTGARRNKLGQEGAGRSMTFRS